MQILGRPSDLGLESLGLTGQAREFWNLTRGELLERAIAGKEGFVSNSGALVVTTGKFTGRSPKDKFIVNYGGKRDEEIDWGATNQPIEPTVVEELLLLIREYTNNKNLYVQDLLVGNHPSHTQKVRIVTETAWHSLFSINLFTVYKEQKSSFIPDFTIICLPGLLAPEHFRGLNSKTFVVLDFERKLVLIGGTAYAGEIKKAVFSIMNRILPEADVFPMHCSANIGKNGDTALFFGLSGTGKTTLSSDPERYLIGDDEHGWGNDGVFNFEGGCYAKTIGLKKEFEPIIWEACQRKGAILENVAVDSSGHINFDDCSLTENSRAAYPLEFVPNAVKEGQGNHPANIFFLTADAFGVLPPLSLLNQEQAMFYFLTGFTAKLAGTECGIGKEPVATFSTCYAAPFLPLSPIVYAEMLRAKMAQHASNVWLVNTGWTGGPYGLGHRIHLPDTRDLIQAAIHGEISKDALVREEVFGLAIPTSCKGISEPILDPMLTWPDREKYLAAAGKLKLMFAETAKKYYEGR